VKTIIKLMSATAALAAATCFDIPSSRAFGDAPWCAVTERGDGDVHWDCEYHSVEECVPNVLAGNRGFCNLNPRSGPSMMNGTAGLRHRKSHARD
jgi:hypothetical protein